VGSWKDEADGGGEEGEGEGEGAGEGMVSDKEVLGPMNGRKKIPKVDRSSLQLDNWPKIT
jgi:hypothetical protein